MVWWVEATGVQAVTLGPFYPQPHYVVPLAKVAWGRLRECGKDDYLRLKNIKIISPFYLHYCLPAK